MLKKVNSRFIGLLLLFAVLLAPLATSSTQAKYLITGVGVAGYAQFSGDTVTGIFAITDEMINNGNLTSESKFGLDTMKPVVDENGNPVLNSNGEPMYNIPNQSSVEGNGLDDITDRVFSVQNATDNTILLVTFDIVICIGITSPAMTATISEQKPDDTIGTYITLTLATSGTDADIVMKKSDTITTDLENAWGLIKYSVFETHIDPAAHTDKITSTDPSVTDGKLKLKSFILIDPGETKDFKLSIQLTNENFWQQLSKNCFASLTMTVIPFDYNNYDPDTYTG